MSEVKPSAIQIIGQSRLIFGFYLVTALLLVAVSAISFQAPHLIGMEKALLDFDAFYIAGTLAGQGDVGAAYDSAANFKAQAEIASDSGFMPWTYPPPFTLLVDLLANLPIGTAYALFSLATFAFYVAVLRRIAGEWFFAVLILLMPIVMLNLRTGQNGFLVAGLIGAFLLAWRDNKAIAGLPLGLLIIKPHLAVGVGLLALFGRRRDVIAIAAGVVLAAASLATLAYGLDVWSSFLSAVKEAGTFLALGYYPMVRMSSIFAALLSAGLPSSVAMAGHVAGALVAVILLAGIALARFEFRYRAALICVLSLFVSPYNYDYDLAILGIGLAFIMPDLVARASQWSIGGLLALAWATGGYGLITQGANSSNGGPQDVGMTAAFAAICPLLIAMCAMVFWLIRSNRPVRADSPESTSAVI